MDKFDVTMLFETEYWNGNKIENMKSSHIVNTLLMLRRNAKDYKRQYEYFLIDNQDGKVLTTIDDINNMSRRDLIYRLESRMRALQNESKKEAASRHLANLADE